MAATASPIKWRLGANCSATSPDHLQQHEGLETAEEVAQGVKKPIDQVQKALTQLVDDKQADVYNGRYGTPAQVQATKELAKRIRDQLALTKDSDTADELAKALKEPDPKVQSALDQLKIQGEVSDWNGRYGTPDEVDEMRQLGRAILDHLKAVGKLETADQIAKALNKSKEKEKVQRALDHLEAQKQVGQWDHRYGLPEAVAELTELGREIVAHLKQTGLQSAAELAKALGKPIDQVQAALDQLVAQEEVSNWNGRYDLTADVEAMKQALADRILTQLPETPNLDTAGELAEALGEPRKSVQNVLDELQSQDKVKEFKGRYGTPDEVDRQSKLHQLVPDVSLLAGSGSAAYANGQGEAASFDAPVAVASDASGTVYVVDLYNQRIRKINKGLVSDLAGSGDAAHVDAQDESASFNYASGVAVDDKGNVYVADTENQRIRKITKEGMVSTLAGSSASGDADGKKDAARFNYPSGVAVDNKGNVYVADKDNHRIRKITKEGVVSTLAGSGAPGDANGKKGTASFNLPSGVAVDSQDNVYVADLGNHRIRKITSEGQVSTLAGSGKGRFADGQETAASFNGPSGVAVDGEGYVYVADRYNHRIRQITPEGKVTTLAGNGAASYVNGRGTAASFDSPDGVAVDGSGTVYVVESNLNRIRKLVRS